MTYTSDSPITVDGVRLDTLAWNTTKISRATAARRSADVVIPGADGVLASVNDNLEPATMGLELWLRGTNVDGSIPAAGARGAFWANLDELVHLFGKRHGLLEVTEQTGPGSYAVNLLKDPSLEVEFMYSNDGGLWTTSQSGITRRGVGLSTAVTRTGNAPSPAAVSVYRSQDGALLSIPARPGQDYTLGLYVRTDAANRQGLAALTWFAPGGGVITSVIGSPVALTPGAWTLVTITTKAPATAGFVVPGLNVGVVGGANAAAGEVTYVDDVLLTEGDTFPGYFDGSTPADDLHVYAWTGAVNASTSKRIPRSQRRTFAKVTDTMAPEVNEPGAAGVFTAALTIPSGCWEDAAPPTDWGSTPPLASGTPMEVTTLRGATERNTDAVLVVIGPINNPRITDPTTGSYVQLNQNLAAGAHWQVDLARWSSRYGAGIGFTPGTPGTDGAPFTVYGGAQSVSTYLTLQPTRTATDPTRRTYLALSGTGGITAETQLVVRARRKFAL